MKQKVILISFFFAYNIVQLGTKLNTKLGPHTTTTHHPVKLLGHFQACKEAEIWYVGLTHKYKMIQGEKNKLNPIPRGGLKSYFPFQRVLGSVRG